jgi:hypothetical protein
MSDQVYRADVSKQQADGAVVWRTQWRGGEPVAKINNCRLMMAGDMRRTVYITGEPDTYFSVPAVCRIGGCRVRGYVSHEDDDGDLVFHHTYY